MSNFLSNILSNFNLGDTKIGKKKYINSNIERNFVVYKYHLHIFHLKKFCKA